MKLGLISTLEFQTNQCLCSHFWALVVDQYCQAKITLWTLQTIYNIPMKENLSTPWANTILICGGHGLRPWVFSFSTLLRGLAKLNTHYNSPDYAAVYPGAILMALNVVLPELWFAPPMVILILLLSSRYHSRVSPVARLRKIDSHCVVMLSPGEAMLYQAIKYHTSAPL